MAIWFSGRGSNLKYKAVKISLLYQYIRDITITKKFIELWADMDLRDVMLKNK